MPNSHHCNADVFANVCTAECLILLRYLPVRTILGCRDITLQLFMIDSIVLSPILLRSGTKDVYSSTEKYLSLKMYILSAGFIVENI